MKKKVIITALIIAFIALIVSSISLYSDVVTRDLILESYSKDSTLVNRFNQNTLYSLILFMVSFISTLCIVYITAITFSSKKDSKTSEEKETNL